MFPFLCEITLACIISYHFALLVMQPEKRVSKRARVERDTIREGANLRRSRRAGGIGSATCAVASIQDDRVIIPE